MVEGLEVSEVHFSDLENLRTIGSEYYSQEFVENIEIVKDSPYLKVSLSDASKINTDGDHGKTKYVDNGVLYLLSESVQPGYIDVTRGTRFISEETHHGLKRSLLKPGDVVAT